MGYRFTYSGIVPDVEDTENKSREKPGHLFEIAEKDGGIVIQMMDPNDAEKVQDHHGVWHDPSYKGVFMGYAEAEDMVRGLQKAISEAKATGNGKDLHDYLEVKNKMVN